MCTPVVERALAHSTRASALQVEAAGWRRVCHMPALLRCRVGLVRVSVPLRGCRCRWQVYDRLLYRSAPFVHLASVAGMRARTVTTSSFGKTMQTTGWKVQTRVGVCGGEAAAPCGRFNANAPRSTPSASGRSVYVCCVMHRARGGGM
jgi:hypothetical protein